MVTHDLDSIWSIVDRLSVLGDKKIVAQGTLEDVIKTDHPVVAGFFKGVRGSVRSVV